MIKRVVASAKVIIAFFTHLYIVKTRETRKVTKITKRKRISFLLSNYPNIQIVVEVS